MLNKEIKLLGWNGDHEKRIAVLEKLVKKVSKKALQIDSMNDGMDDEEKRGLLQRLLNAEE